MRALSTSSSILHYLLDANVLTKISPVAMTTIQFDEDIPRPVRENTIDFEENTVHLRRSRSRVSTHQYDDGIYHMRAIHRATSIDRRSLRTNTEIEDDDPGLKQAGDFQGKQVPQRRKNRYAKALTNDRSSKVACFCT